MGTKLFKIDFKDVKDKQDILQRLHDVFLLNEHDIQMERNWDSFMDWFVNLDSDSEIIRKMDPLPTKVVLEVYNIGDVYKASEKEFNNLVQVLAVCTLRDYRGDEIQFDVVYVGEV